jgi:secreted Zn-dependent insulinase-like peptidase
MNNDMFLAKLVNMNYDEFFVSSSISKFWYVKGYMERNMPEVWEEYVDHCFVLFRYDKKTAFECLNKALNPENLVTYLSEHREWGETVFHAEEGLNTIKHPALVYLEV